MLSHLLRWLHIKADSQIDPFTVVFAFWQLLLFSTVQQYVEYMTDLVVFNSTQVSIHTLLFSITYGILFGGSFLKKTRHSNIPFLLAIVMALLDYPTRMIYGANHYHLNTLALVITSTALLLIQIVSRQQRRDADTRQISWDTIYLLRWLVVYLMLWTGLNKLIYGTYFQGEYLAYVLVRELGETAKRSSFLEFYSYLLPAQELEQLQGNVTGPFRFQSPLAVVGANLVYLLEITAGLFLLIPKTRIIGAWLTFAVLVGIEIAAREWVFGSLLCQLILLFFPQFFLKHGFCLMCVSYTLVTAYLILFGAGLIPDLGIT